MPSKDSFRPPKNERDARAVEKPLALRLTEEINAGIEQVVQRAVKKLRAEGWELEPVGALEWAVPVGKKQLQVSVLASLGVSSELRSGESPKAPVSPFYEEYERVAKGKPARRSERERLIFALGSLETELANGGFHQYFFNTASDHLNDAFQALREVGAVETFELLGRAVAAFPEEEVPLHRELRQKALLQGGRKLEATLGELDRLFYDSGESLGSLGTMLLKG